MPRFTLNRHLAFILALSIALASAPALFPSIGVADEGPLTSDHPIGGDSAGDPDRPSGGGKSMRGRPYGGGMGIERGTAGDGAGAYSVGMMRLRVALWSLKGLYFRF